MLAERPLEITRGEERQRVEPDSDGLVSIEMQSGNALVYGMLSR